jgi:hypothetical protein
MQWNGLKRREKKESFGAGKEHTFPFPQMMNRQRLFAEKGKQPFSWVLAGFWQRSLRRSWVLAVVQTTLK